MAKYCYNCGNELKSGEDICLKCGKIINENVNNQQVYKDPNDGQIWYELECEDPSHTYKMRYDYPEEVLKRVIDYRTNKLTSSMSAEREKILIYLSKLIRDVKIVEDVMKEKGNKVVETRSRK